MSCFVTNIQGTSIHDGPGIRTVVFLKGCSLDCLWCSNPECISPQPEVGLVKALCAQCGKCATVCSNKAIIGMEGRLPIIQRERCSGCGLCSSHCPREALVLYGKPMTVEEVFEVVKRDQMFYESSGGGVTLSGGEPLLKPQFASQLLQRCREAGIHTCIETAGNVSEEALTQVLEYTDLVLFDLKQMDPRKHCQYTGASNQRILRNARIAAATTDLMFRMPLIPGVNDDTENIKETAEFIHGLEKEGLSLQLMPYHQLGKGKYDSLGKAYRMQDSKPLEKGRAEEVKAMFEALGIPCSISR